VPLAGHTPPRALLFYVTISAPVHVWSIPCDLLFHCTSSRLARPEQASIRAPSTPPKVPMNIPIPRFLSRIPTSCLSTEQRLSFFLFEHRPLVLGAKGISGVRTKYKKKATIAAGSFLLFSHPSRSSPATFTCPASAHNHNQPRSWYPKRQLP